MTEAHLDVVALFAALDEQRRSRKLSWRQVAAEVGVSASTLTRISQEKRPDVDSFAALVHWLGVPAESFLRPASKRPRREPEPLAMISTYLRARKDLSARSATALEDIIRAAYERLKD